MATTEPFLNAYHTMAEMAVEAFAILEQVVVIVSTIVLVVARPAIPNLKNAHVIKTELKKEGKNDKAKYKNIDDQFRLTTTIY